MNESKKPYHSDVIYFEAKKEDVEVEVAMQWNDSYSESIYSYCNNINTIEGGSHLVGFRELSRGQRIVMLRVRIY